MLSRADRKRVERLERNGNRFRALAEHEPDERRKARHLTTARRIDRVVRMRRIYPLTVWLWSVAVVVALSPWAVLNALGHGDIGIVASAILSALLLAIRHSRIRRQWGEL
jgi:hypothetical protein